MLVRLSVCLNYIKGTIIIIIIIITSSPFCSQWGTTVYVNPFKSSSNYSSRAPFNAQKCVFSFSGDNENEIPVYY